MTSTTTPSSGDRENRLKVLEVFADIACPFTHVGLHNFRLHRQRRGRSDPVLHVRAWPLELVNGQALDGPSLVPKVEALRATVAPDLFAGFDENAFPATTRPALAAEAAAYRHGLAAGERFSFAVRHALFEEGLDISDDGVLGDLLRACGIPPPPIVDQSAVLDDYAEGKRRGVVGSPHFFTPDGDFFCPSLEIHHGADGYDVTFDRDGFERFMVAALD